MNNDYAFLTHWRFKATVDQVYDLISEPLEYPRWWPSVYLEITELDPGDATGIGQRLRLHTRGWLPYTILWESVATEIERPRRLAIRALGDFDGAGIWTLTQDGEFTDVLFDWRLTAEKPLLRRLSFVLKPVFSANHRWAMARGEQSLNLELARQRATTAEERDQIPAPPGPNKTSALWLGFGTVVFVAVLILLVRLIFFR
jgi:uncharacterized protein YndB with AHSA1/START domain